MLFDSPKVGESQYGMYYLYAVRNGDGTTEYSFFATDEVHEKLSGLKKGDSATITKQAVQKGSKVVTTFEVVVDKKAPEKATESNGSYLQAMISSFEDALVIQERFNGMANVNQIAITLFIQRTKGGGYRDE